jgi:DNA-binding response OmpR family regulator
MLRADPVGEVLSDTEAVSDTDRGARSILLVEDDEEIAGLMRDFLEAEGFHVCHAATGRETTEELRRARPDCVLLDVMLPDESGFEICRRLRRDSDIPVLFLSARDGDADKIRGLGLGGDDYVVKSATPGEVVARVKAVLRRAGPPGGISGRQRLRFGDLEVDLAAHEVAREGKRVEMTAREFEVLRVFVEHPRQVLSRDHLFELIWGSFGDRSAVPVYIRRLREKIELDPAKPRYIVTVWGAGYRFDGGLT